jgi:hypothetical protein
MNNKDFQIIRAILAGYNQVEGWNTWDENDQIDVPGFGTITVVFAHRPLDENGRSAELVFEMIDPDTEEKIYFKKTGSYESWDGLHWNGPFAQATVNVRTVYDYE